MSAVGPLASEVAVEEPALTLFEHVERLGLVGLHGGDGLCQHRSGLLRGAELLLRERGAGDGEGDERPESERGKTVYGALRGSS